MTRAIDRCIRLFCGLSSLSVFGSVAFLLGYLVIKSLPVLNLKLIFGDIAPLDALLFVKPVFNGIFPAMAGTVLLVLTAMAVAIPLGLSGGIYMAEYSSGPVKGIFSFSFDLLSGIPSIVIGLFGFSITLFLHAFFKGKIAPCLLISALSLAFLVLPYMVKSTQLALESLPESTRITGLALGATKFQNIRHVLVPEALSHILGGIILAMGRCAEDTAVIMLTGVVASAGIPGSLFKGFEALPFFIYYISSQYTDARELSMGYGACVILIVLCTMLYLIAFIIQKQVKHTVLYRI
ncbi:MAG: ABC transporter permease subunit [Pseudomonadota bacterium]